MSTSFVATRYRWAIMLAGSMSAAGALAQTAPPTPEDNSGQLQEVTVTATKQAAIDVNKVPISISAYGQAEMDLRGIKDVSDLAAITPGLIFTLQNNNGTPQTNIEIRGIQSRTSAPTTGIYLDDTPMVGRANNVNTGENSGYPQVFDLDRVEVLRGPQGTLFGASSEGGVVRFLTNQPNLTQSSLYARSEVGDTRYGDPSYEAGIAGGMPLIEGALAVRGSIWYRVDGGWVDRVEPPVGAGPFSPAINPAEPGGELLKSDANWSRTMAAKLAVTWAPNDWLKVTPSVFWQDARTGDTSGYDVQFSNPSDGKFAVAHSQALPSDDPTTISTLKVEAFRGDLAVTSITSNYERRATWETDYTQFQDYAFFGDPWPLTGAANDYGTGYYETYENATSEELRLSNANPEDRLTWLAGVYSSYTTQEDTVFVLHPDLPDLVQAIYGQSITAILGAPPYEGLYVAYDDVKTRDVSNAVFANVDFKITPTLKLTGGVRAAYSTSHTFLHFDGSFNGGPGFFSGDETDKPVTPKGGLTWQPTDNSTYYISAAKGYRVGGVNPQINNTQAACQTALAADNLTGKLSRTYAPDSLWSYEIGAKEKLLDNRLEVQLSAFHIRWNGIQQSIGVAGCGFAAVFNLGTADSNGFDMSLRAAATDHLKLGMQVAYTDAHYDQSVGNIVAAGEAIGGPGSSTVPPWTVTTSAEFTFQAFGKDSYFWIEDAYHSANHGPFTSYNPANIVVYDPGLKPDPATNMLNARVGVRLKTLDVSLFANNLTDSHPELSFEHTDPGDPRYQATTFRPLTVGVTAVLRY